MRRLIAWIMTLISASSLLLVSLYGSGTASCVQLLSSWDGNILTVDMKTGTAMLDSRTIQPLPPAELEDNSYNLSVSPDRRFIIDRSTFGDIGVTVYQLNIRPRSINHRTPLNTDTPVERFAWSPTSTYFAFTEIGDWNTNNLFGNLVSLAIADTKGNILQRASIPTHLDDSWRDALPKLFWSPDGVVVALPLLKSNIGGTLLWHSVMDNTSIYLPFANESVVHVGWSPMNDYAFIVTSEIASETYHAYLIKHDGSGLKPLRLPSGFAPTYEFVSGDAEAQHWSPDGQYFVLRDAMQHRLLAFDLNGKLLLPDALNVEQFLWAALPHTLIYLTRQGTQLPLMQLELASGHITPLINNVYYTIHRRAGDNNSDFYVTEQREQGDKVLHLFSRDLSKHTTPFAPLITGNEIFPDWSQDQSKLVVTEPTELNVLWRIEATGEIRRFQLDRKGGADLEWISGGWFDNDKLFILRYWGNQIDYYLLDTNTLQSVLLQTVPQSSAGFVWRDDVRFAMTSPQGITVYQLSDGQPLYTVKSPGSYPYTIVHPDGNSILMQIHENYVDQLFLASPQSMNRVIQAPSMTKPAWSPDGTMFTVGVMPAYDKGWRVQVFSRAGFLLKDYLVEDTVRYSSYQEIRWTSCD